MRSPSYARVLAALSLSLCAVLVASSLLGGALALEKKRGASHHLQWQYCKPMEAQTANITSVRMQPYPPKAGDTITLTVSGRNGKPLQSCRPPQRNAETQREPHTSE